MTLAEAISFMPSNQRLEIRTMGVELFTGSKGSLEHSVRTESIDWINAVSYTHLTLPTIYSV